MRDTITYMCIYIHTLLSVTHFRVQLLTELTKHVDSSRGAESGLSALFMLYHSYCPHMVGKTQLSRKRVNSSFKKVSSFQLILSCRFGFVHLKSNLRQTLEDYRRQDHQNAILFMLVCTLYLLQRMFILFN